MDVSKSDAQGSSSARESQPMPTGASWNGKENPEADAQNQRSLSVETMYLDSTEPVPKPKGTLEYS